MNQGVGAGEANLKKTWFVQYAKSLSIQYFIDIDILQNSLINIDSDINTFNNVLIDIDIDIFKNGTVLIKPP